MQKIRHTIGICIILLGVMLFSGCEHKEEPASRLIVVLSSMGGIGDRGYNDAIMRGIEHSYLTLPSDAYMYIYNPTDIEMAESVVDDYLTAGSHEGTEVLLVLASSDYYDLTLKKIADPSLSSHTEIMLFEVPELPESVNGIKTYSFIINMYEACYQAGVYAGESGKERPLVWLANSIDPLLGDFLQGFAEGYHSVTNTYPDTAYLSNDWSGYSMSQEAYQAMADISKQYDFVFPVMGGSNMGIYRYLREHEDGPDVAGMDVDQSIYSAHVVGNVIKHIDIVVEDYISKWLNKEYIPEYMEYDAQSGYIEWMLVTP